MYDTRKAKMRWPFSRTSARRLSQIRAGGPVIPATGQEVPAAWRTQLVGRREGTHCRQVNGAGIGPMVA